MNKIFKKKNDVKVIDKQSILILTFFSLIIIGAVIFQVFRIFPNSIGVDKTQQVPKELVCMVNDAYMGKDQILVPVGEKIYYGCCEMCVTKLQNMREVRYAIDPFSGDEVDKASSYIVLKGDGTDAVLYFESEENYLNYLENK